MPWRAIPAEYKGVKYKSMSRLYKAMRDHLRKYAHREPSINYANFLETYKNSCGDVESAVFAMTDPKHKKPILNLKADSIRLQGADNLVCQRMTKLGWSYEKAISTPRNTKHLPIQVKYKGKVYPSITACYKAVKPKENIIKFTQILREKGYIK